MPEPGRGWIRRQSRTQEISYKLLPVMSFFCGLTPELSRAAARLGGVVHVPAQAEPRSGLGSNELLGRASGCFYLATQTRIPTNLTLARRYTRQGLLPRAPSGEPAETNRRSEQLSRRRLMKSGAPCGMRTEGETRVRRERSGGEHGRDVGFNRSWAMNSHGPA
jgi:hypothetical protein